MDLHCIHSSDIFFTGGSILCETPQNIRGLDDYLYGLYMYVCMNNQRTTSPLNKTGLDVMQSHPLRSDELQLQVVQSLLARLMFSVTFLKLKTEGPIVLVYL